VKPSCVAVERRRREGAAEARLRPLHDRSSASAGGTGRMSSITACATEGATHSTETVTFDA
jgi:hypothetical protein